ncbi:MAG: M43 family zinc metalloprotease [Candidatus Eiseniibacteriota bacterium]
MRFRRLAIVAAGIFAFAAATPVPAEPVRINGLEFDSWQDYVHSDYFKQNGMRCGTQVSIPEDGMILGVPNDCGSSNTNPLAEYDPGATITIPVVVHIITNTAGTVGQVPDALVHSQIDILNEDFLALTGTNGANGNYAAIQFQLATEDPLGNPTTGITHSANTTWYNDGGNYFNTLAWDTDVYLNIYTNSAQGFLGYVPNLPQGGGVGLNSDRVVILWSAFGRDAPVGPPYDQGRTATHEVGHYLGLYHTFQACGTAATCHTSGDFICDTNPEASPTFGCPGSRLTCTPPVQAPVENYMDYSDDLCMTEFTVEQVNRMRCTIEHWRPNLPLPGAVGANVLAERSAFQLLHQNVPNPFHPMTQIRFDLPASADVSLRVMDVAGRTVRTLAGGRQSAGSHQVSWDGTDEANAPVAAGVYFYRLETSLGSETRQMVKVK